MAKKAKVPVGEFVIVELTEADIKKASKKKNSVSLSDLVADKVDAGEYARFGVSNSTHEAFGKDFSNTIESLRQGIEK